MDIKMESLSSECPSCKNKEFIFVYGDNEAHRHGKFAAFHARIFHGAVNGIGGFFGRSYGIPTKDKNLKILPLWKIKEYVDHFIGFAEINSDKKFAVTAIGTGASRYNHSDIAPMFIGAPKNCYFDVAWRCELGYTYSYWN
jgi:hypothetical protein